MPKLQLVAKHALSADANREFRINCNSFQQDAIVNYNGWQYACFYTSQEGAKHTPEAASPLVVGIARRHESDPDAWEKLTLEDYVQVVDDGHNTISIGICPGDGTIHVAFDHHCDPLRYRISRSGVASDPTAHKWTAALFGPVQNRLPGSTLTPGQFAEVTYPRFLAVRSGLLFSFRVGKAGSGSDMLYRYEPQTGEYEYVGEFLTGVDSNPYINGISYARGLVHVSGCYRGFIEYEGARDATSTTHKANAGPNGPENNFGLFYVYSSDDGKTWKNTHGNDIASLTSGKSVLPDAEGLIVFDIPRNSGIMNQEGQACDGFGGFHVLNRENEVWIHYYRSPAGSWSKNPVSEPQPTNTGSRGSIISINDYVYLALPGNTDSSLTIVASKILDNALGPQELVWSAYGYNGEPHLSTLQEGQIVSVFTTSAEPQREVVVLDLREERQ